MSEREREREQSLFTCYPIRLMGWGCRQVAVKINGLSSSWSHQKAKKPKGEKAKLRELLVLVHIVLQVQLPRSSCRVCVLICFNETQPWTLPSSHGPADLANLTLPSSVS